MGTRTPLGWGDQPMFFLFMDSDRGTKSHIYAEAKTEEEAVEKSVGWIGQEVVWIQCHPCPPTERRDVMEKAEEKFGANTI